MAIRQLEVFTLGASDQHVYDLDATPPMTAGVDEVGRGCLLGPVVAASVIVPPSAVMPLTEAGVKDSKQLSPRRRAQLYEQILQCCPASRIGLASVSEIDRMNILQASLRAMHRAVTRLPVIPEFCLVDGNQRIPDLAIPQQTVIKGDGRVLAIAAASIIAKVWRDRLLIRLDAKYPGYDLAANKGYGTQKHRQALTLIGPCRQHRMSFAPCQQAAPAQ